MMKERFYNDSINESVLGRQESLDPKKLKLLTYGRPGDNCQIDGQDFPSGKLGNTARISSSDFTYISSVSMRMRF